MGMKMNAGMPKKGGPMKANGSGMDRSGRGAPEVKTFKRGEKQTITAMKAPMKGSMKRKDKS